MQNHTGSNHRLSTEGDSATVQLLQRLLIKVESLQLSMDEMKRNCRCHAPHNDSVSTRAQTNSKVKQ